MVRNLIVLLLSFIFLHSSLQAAVEVGGYQHFIDWVLTQQASFHRELVSLVRSISKEGSAVLLWSLITTSFFYGVFHAAGPGHGKAVISSYMLASQAPLRKGIGLSFVCAGIQAIMAILIIVVLSQIFSLAGKAMQISRFFEVASFAAVGLIGVWMLIRLIRGKSSCGHDHSHDGDHSHHEHSHHHGHDHHNHEHHSHDHFCNHAKQEATTARRSIWAMVAAVGIRPCTGAVLVLLFSISADIFVWGLVATFAMALGTAITVASLAAISVFVRDYSLALSHKHTIWKQRITKTFGIMASLALILISTSMIWSYLSNVGRAF